MKCPIDKTEMEKGIIDETATGWMSGKSFLGKISSIGVGITWGKNRIWAYRCPKCGKVELTTEVEG